MYAEVEPTEEIINFINNTKNQNESFDDIKEISFSKEMKKKKLSALEIFNYTMMFHKIKTSAYNKVINREKLNLPEGLVFERLLLKYNNEELPSFEEYMTYINNNCTEIKSKKNKVYDSLFKLLKGEF